MAFEIHTSQFWDGADQNAFENAVQDYINTMHTFNRVVGKPRPTAIHPLVERAVKRIQKQGQPDQYVADFIVIDDTPPPPPPPSLEERKNMLISKLRFAENAAVNTVHPVRKLRLAYFNYNKALLVDEDKRTDSHLEDIALVKRIQLFTEDAQMIAAKAEADIEDLTEQTIDSWQLPAFG